MYTACAQPESLQPRLMKHRLAVKIFLIINNSQSIITAK